VPALPARQGRAGTLTLRTTVCWTRSRPAGGRVTADRARLVDPVGRTLLGGGLRLRLRESLHAVGWLWTRGRTRGAPGGVTSRGDARLVCWQPRAAQQGPTIIVPAVPAGGSQADTCAALDARKQRIDAAKQQVNEPYRDDCVTCDRLKAALDTERQAINTQKESLGCSPTPRGSVASPGVPPEGVGAIAHYVPRPWLPRSVTAGHRAVFSGSAGSQHTEPSDRKDLHHGCSCIRGGDG
jgi:hypothetical protein